MLTITARNTAAARKRAALRRIAAQRSRQRRLLADLRADQPAKVQRPKRMGPMPTPVACRPEPLPYDKFGGC